MEIKPVTLEGKYVRLEPLSTAHLSGLCSIGLDPELWRWTPFVICAPEEMQNHLESALQAQRRWTALPFTITERSSGRIRHTVYFSIVNSEWPQVESQLQEKLRRPFRREY